MTTLYRNRQTAVLSDAIASFGGLKMLLDGIFSGGRRKQDRDRSMAEVNDLIEHADHHVLSDLGCTRDDLFRMRASLGA